MKDETKFAILKRQTVDWQEASYDRTVSGCARFLREAVEHRVR